MSDGVEQSAPLVLPESRLAELPPELLFKVLYCGVLGRRDVVAVAASDVGLGAVLADPYFEAHTYALDGIDACVYACRWASVAVCARQWAAEAAAHDAHDEPEAEAGLDAADGSLAHLAEQAEQAGARATARPSRVSSAPSSGAATGQPDAERAVAAASEPQQEARSGWRKKKARVMVYERTAERPLLSGQNELELYMLDIDDLVSYYAANNKTTSPIVNALLCVLEQEAAPADVVALETVAMSLLDAVARDASVSGVAPAMVHGLLLAVARGYVAAAEAFLTTCGLDAAEERLLYVAARAGRLAMVELLRAHGAVVTDDALVFAAASGADDVFTTLLAAPGGHACVSVANGGRVLRMTARIGRVPMLDALIAAGVDPSLDDNAALLEAARSGRQDAVDRLLDDERVGAPKRRPESILCTMASAAISSTHMYAAIISRLGIDPGARSSCALKCAVRTGLAGVTAYLLRAPTVDPVAAGGERLAYLALSGGKTKVLRHLLLDSRIVATSQLVTDAVALGDPAMLALIFELSPVNPDEATFSVAADLGNASIIALLNARSPALAIPLPTPSPARTAFAAAVAARSTASKQPFRVVFKKRT